MEPIEPDQLYTLREAYEFLRVSRGTLLRLLARGELRGRKVGRQWRFPGTELLRFLEVNDREGRQR